MAGGNFHHCVCVSGDKCPRVTSLLRVRDVTMRDKVNYQLIMITSQHRNAARTEIDSHNFEEERLTTLFISSGDTEDINGWVSHQ